MRVRVGVSRRKAGSEPRRLSRQKRVIRIFFAASDVRVKKNEIYGWLVTGMSHACLSYNWLN